MASCDWLIWNSRAEVPLTFVLCYIICFLLYNQKRVGSLVASKHIGNLQDLGSIPGPPPFPYIFLLIVFSCSFSPKRPPYAPHSNVPHVPQSPSKGQDLRPMICCSQRTYTLAKKSIGPRLNGPELLGLYLQLGTETPQGIVFSFFSLCYLFQLFLF